MPLTKEQKSERISSVADKLSKSETLIFTHFAKVSVEKLKELRRELKAKGVDFKVVKKSLLGVALKKANVGAESLDLSHTQEAIGVVFGQKDQIAPSRAIALFSRVKSAGALKIFGGIFGGVFVDKEKIAALGRMASQEDVYGLLVRQIQSPLSRLVYALKAVADKQK